MEEGSRVWLRSPKSEWGWLPAKIVKKEIVARQVKARFASRSSDEKKDGDDTTIELTLVDDFDGLRHDCGPGVIAGGSDSYYANAISFEEIVRIDDTHGEEHPDVKLRNTDTGRGGGDDDLIGLTHLHEPAILHALRLRYNEDVIYTSTGPILLAINPFKVMGGVYGSGLMERYRQKGEEGEQLVPSSSALSPPPRKGVLISNDDGGRVFSSGHEGSGQLPPHVYQAADDAYRAMMRGIEMAAWGRGSRRAPPKKSAAGQEDDANDILTNQSILVSGESGAGKTVTTKIVLNYFAMLSRKSQEDAATKAAAMGNISPKGKAPWTAPKGNQSIENQVVQSNPILEAFGNARTIRNDNSSRFGKYINVAFTDTGRLVRASVDTYLLEKVRLLHQAPGERNFHVFYQLLEAATDAERRKLMLSDCTHHDFHLTNQSGTYDRRDNVQDSDTHAEMVEAMGVMNFGTETVENLMRLVAAVLFAGNMTFSKENTRMYGDASVLDKTDASMAAARLLGVSFDNLAASLTTKVIFARGDVIHKGLDTDQAKKASEALLKSIYGAAFDFIAEKINASINFGSEGKRGGAPGTPLRRMSSDAPVNFDNIVPPGGASIGVLDIFGFESFESNSFEQFCINYTNETLQQQFNKFVFKLEQKGTFFCSRTHWHLFPLSDYFFLTQSALTHDQSTNARGSFGNSLISQIIRMFWI